MNYASWLALRIYVRIYGHKPTVRSVFKGIFVLFILWVLYISFHVRPKIKSDRPLKEVENYSTYLISNRSSFIALNSDSY